MKLIKVSLVLATTAVLSGCVVEQPGYGYDRPPAHAYGRPSANVYINNNDYDDDDRHHHRYHCPPGQAKKGNC